MHTFFVNGLILLCCLRHVSNKQVFIHRKTCTCSFMVLFHVETLRPTFLRFFRNPLAKHTTSKFMTSHIWCNALCLFELYTLTPT